MDESTDLNPENDKQVDVVPETAPNPTPPPTQSANPYAHAKPDLYQPRMVSQPQGVSPTRNLPSANQAPAKKGRSKSLLLVLIVLAVLGGGGYLAYNKFIKPAQSNAPEAVNTSQPTNTSPTLATYNNAGISFSYNSTWETRKLSELLETSMDTGDPTLFFTPTAMTEVDTKIAAAKNSTGSSFNDALNLIITIPRSAELSVTNIASATAKSLADSATQSVCSGDTAQFSTENPINQSRIKTVTIDSKSAYGIVSEANCAKKSYQLFFDAADGSATIISFANADSKSALSEDQKIVRDSLKIQ